MKSKLLYSLLFFALLFGCNKEKTDSKKSTRTELIYAENDYEFYGAGDKIGLKIYSDSSYLYVKYNKDYDNSETIERVTGKIKTVNDTLLFTSANFKPYNGTRAVIKNDFVEFVDGEYPLRIEIKTTTIAQKNKLNFENFKDYAVFSFNPKYYPTTYYGYKANSIKPYDINQKELEEIDKIIKKCFAENASELRNINEYVKQCVVVKNAKQEIEVWIDCFCKRNQTDQTYKYYRIRMFDGGNCNIGLKINLTRHTYSDLNIAGEV